SVAFTCVLGAMEKEIGISLPNDLRRWLLALGYGDINEELSFRAEWFALIESGQLQGGARFAEDILGNFYAFDAIGCVFYLCRSQPAFAQVSKSFAEFVEELVRHDYKLLDWVSTLSTEPYEWASDEG
ncbi:MAG: SMI1/KNR4 family protein, partial [Rhodoferax sp.]